MLSCQPLGDGQVVGLAVEEVLVPFDVALVDVEAFHGAEETLEPGNTGDGGTSVLAAGT